MPRSMFTRRISCLSDEIMEDRISRISLESDYSKMASLKTKERNRLNSFEQYEILGRFTCMRRIRVSVRTHAISVSGMPGVLREQDARGAIADCTW